jgi:hypothetical protein
MPKGWRVSVDVGNVARLAEIFIDEFRRSAHINLDEHIFEDKDIAEGSKLFMYFHEIGHLIHGPDESACDEFAFYHSLRAGVSPYLCYLAIFAFMPEHYQYRVDHLEALLNKNSYLQNISDAD